MIRRVTPESTPPAPRPSLLARFQAEPYRLFFPAGALMGISGVSLWPLFFSGMHRSFYPGMMHARMMIEGFLGALVLGFILTSLTPPDGSRRISRRGLGQFFGLWLLACGLQIGHQWILGDLVFLFLMGWLLRAMRKHKLTVEATPHRLFIFLSYGCACAGVLLSIVGHFRARPDWMLAGANLLHQGWPLLILLSLENLLPNPKEDAVPQLPPRLAHRLALAAGIGVMATLIADAFWAQPIALSLIRTVLATVCLVMTSRVFHFESTGGVVNFLRQTAVVLLFAGLLFPVCSPIQRVAGLHTIFLGGFTLMALAAATQLAATRKALSRNRFYIAAASLMFVALIMRVAGDYLPLARASWLNHSAYLWMLAAGLWSWAILAKPRARKAETPAVAGT